MTNKATKYGLMTIAAVLLVAMAFAGVASADKWTDAGNFNTTWYDTEYCGGDSIYHIYDAPSLAALSEKVTVNATKVNFSDKTIVIMNNINLAGHEWTPIGTEMYKFDGAFDGNYHTISGFSFIDGGTSNIGFIGYYNGTSIKNLTIRGFNMTGREAVGGLAGFVKITYATTIENVHAEFGNVVGTTGTDIGGLVGRTRYGTASSSENFVNCSVINCVITAFKGTVGGIIGLGQSSYIKFDACSVINSSISITGNHGNLGGIAGSAHLASSPYFMHNCTVKNCIISGAGNNVGGLVGYTNYATGAGIEKCVVEKCVIVGKNNVAGLVAKSASVCCNFTGGENWLIESAIRGTGNVTSVIGYTIDNRKELTDYPGEVTSSGTIWVNNNSNTNYPMIYIAKSTDPAKQGPENPSTFNEGIFADPDSIPNKAQLVTQLTGYGYLENYDALSYVIDVHKITNQTLNGTVIVQNATTSASITKAEKGDIIQVIAVNNTGYYFEGWNVTNKTGLISVDASGNFTMPFSPVNAGANFTPITYTVHFNPNGGQGSMADMTFTYDEGQNLTANAFQRYNSNFLYWTYNGTKYYNTDFVKNLTTVDGDTVEMVAQWETYSTSGSKNTGYSVILQDTEEAADTAANMYTVNFTMNGHGIQVMNQSVSFGNTADEPSPVPTADGYTFTGWYTDKGLVSKYAFSTQVTDDIELYAGWATKDAKIPTSKSPAPFVGMLAGLGAAAVLLRLRK